MDDLDNEIRVVEQQIDTCEKQGQTMLATMKLRFYLSFLHGVKFAKQHP